MSTVRHSHRRLRSGTPLPGIAMVGTALVGLALFGGAALAFGSTGGDAGSRGGAGHCAARRVLTVRAAPGLVDPIRKVASAVGRHAAGERCTTVSVTGQDSADTVGSLAVAQPGGTVPDVWIPDSDHWLALARTSAGASRLLPAGGTVIATSPTVIAMPRPMAAALGWPTKQFGWGKLRTSSGDPTFWSKVGHPGWDPFRLQLASPAASVASLQAVVGYAAEGGDLGPAEITPATFDRSRPAQAAVLDLDRAGLIAKSEQTLLAGLRSADESGRTFATVSATPMQESDMIAYNRGVGFPAGRRPKVPLVAVYPTDALYNQQIPYVVLTSASAAVDDGRARAAADLLAALQAGPGQADLATAGFRSPAGVNGALTPDSGALGRLPKTTPTAIAGAALASGQRLFSSIQQRGAILAVLDVSGSMDEIVPGTKPPQSKLRIAVDACLAGLRLFAPDNLVGSWHFSTDQDGTKPYQQLSPVIPLNARGRHGTHYDDLARTADNLRAGGDTALYETTLAAYQDRTKNYVPGKLNYIVLLTDGKEDVPGDPHPLTLSALVGQLTRLYDPRRPVHIITIAFGSDAAAGPLEQISAATHARSYQSRRPQDVLDVLIDAVLESGR